MNRRTFLAALGATPSCLIGCHDNHSSADTFDRIARDAHGRVGIAALDTATRRRLALDSEARYAMCSTSKVPIVAAALAKVDRGETSLDARVPFGDADILEYAPVVRAHRAEGAISLAALCAAAIEQSDNSAANLLLSQIGGPAGLTAFMRSRGDAISRLDRTEPSLNDVGPGDVRDTTTPTAMVTLLETLLVGDGLSSASRARLNEWMARCATGARRLRAGFPATWHVGDKTGTGGHGKFNDVAIATPPGRAPVLVAMFIDAPALAPPAAESLFARAARIVVRTFP